MVLGTSSHVGKSLITAALCRIFADAGYRVAPFKSQNMSLNSAATVEGLEIGRAQALQAEAAGVAASVHMNPILLKPCGDMSSQVVVHGKVWGKVSAADYHLRRVEELMPMVRASYETLAAAHEVILIEGAGSPAEINLKEHDIVNMRIAAMADARCLLVGDIDRGGVFAALWGTVALLDPDEQARIDGFLINKFRGDVALLEPGIRMIEERLGKPCAGVVPWLDHLALEEEDSLGLDVAAQSVSWTETGDARPLRIAVIAYPTFSNFTDFDSLRMEPSVALRFCRSPEEMEHADVVVLPGSKQTLDDLRWMQTRKLDRALHAHARSGLIAGVCGGMQMLGQHIFDPLGMETEGSIRGLGLLPIETTMQPQKVTCLARMESCSPLRSSASPCLRSRSAATRFTWARRVRSNTRSPSACWRAIVRGIDSCRIMRTAASRSMDASSGPICTDSLMKTPSGTPSSPPRAPFIISLQRPLWKVGERDAKSRSNDSPTQCANRWISNASSSGLAIRTQKRYRCRGPLEAQPAPASRLSRRPPGR